jgi:hypothetical protein
MTFALDRTVGAPSMNADTTLVLSAEMEYSYDGGLTFPRAGSNANGGSFTTTGGLLSGGRVPPTSSFTTHVPRESDVTVGGNQTKMPTHMRMNFSVAGGTLNSSLTVTLS